jgi:N utilization substance protein B
MISRRLVRIKAMQTYYAFLQDNGGVSTDSIWKELRFNIEKSYELYIYLHCFLIALTDFAEDRIENNRKKHIPTDEDLNPNTRFVENNIIQALRNNAIIKKYYNNNDYNWSDYPEFTKSTWGIICQSDFYNEYMQLPNTSVKEDARIITKIITKVLSDNDQLDEILEEKSIYWNDDLEFLLSNIIQNIKKIQKDNFINYSLQDIFKNEADENFAKDLIVKTAIYKDKFDSIILDTLKKWELERIAFTDRVILHLALCEIFEFPDMPVKVTINEYIDISKYYSTEKSSIFINGILDKIYGGLKDENTLNKKGLGLVE